MQLGWTPEQIALRLPEECLEDRKMWVFHETLYTYLYKQIDEEDTGATIYFCDPQSPGQRDKNENTNGRLRRVYPKRTDLSTITQRELNKIIRLMNATSRKSLNWRTPDEVYTELVAL